MQHGAWMSSKSSLLSVSDSDEPGEVRCSLASDPILTVPAAVGYSGPGLGLKEFITSGDAPWWVPAST